jgi:hypothetical protein
VNHLTSIGEPSYNSTETAVALNTTASSSAPLGTAYVISYNFQQYYSYKITINVKKVNIGSASGSGVSLRAELNNGGNGNNTSCTLILHP